MWLGIFAHSASAYCGEPQYAEFERDIMRERVRAGLAHAPAREAAGTAAQGRWQGGFRQGPISRRNQQIGDCAAAENRPNVGPPPAGTKEILIGNRPTQAYRKDTKQSDRVQNFAETRKWPNDFATRGSNGWTPAPRGPRVRVVRSHPRALRALKTGGIYARRECLQRAIPMAARPLRIVATEAGSGTAAFWLTSSVSMLTLSMSEPC